jgi:predicted nucleic acid-binding protein
MIRVVIDTNIVVSANLKDYGLPAAVLDLATGRKVKMFVSPAVLAEYEDVRFSGMDTRVVADTGQIRIASQYQLVSAPRWRCAWTEFSRPRGNAVA